jgi:hypothetical protein
VPSTEDRLAFVPQVRVTPSWQAIVVGILVAVLLGIVAGVTAFVSQQRANDHTDHRIARLEADLAERRRVAAEANARRDQQIAETQRIVCVVMNRVQPRDAEVEKVRAQFNCAAQPDPVGSPPR